MRFELILLLFPDSITVVLFSVPCVVNLTDPCDVHQQKQLSKFIFCAYSSNFILENFFLNQCRDGENCLKKTLHHN